MKTNRLIYIALVAAAIVAFAIVAAPVSASAKVAGLLGYGVILTLATLGVMEYGRGSHHGASR